MDTPQQPQQAPAPQPQPAPEVAPQPDPGLQTQPPEQPKSNKTLWILLTILIVLLAGGAIWYFMFVSK